MPHAVRLLAKMTLATLAVAGFGSCATTRPTEREGNLPTGWPVARNIVVVSSEFGSRRGGSSHQGIDLSAPEGTPVKATADGVITFRGRSNRYGRTVVIDHGGGWQTRYAHLKRIKVDGGQRVSHGEVIGSVGKSGNATGFHLHYEIIRNGSQIDPWPYLER
jgi:murein DD-endopeptidase MepM/ murein hydrolase activator NlpD